MIFSYKVGFSNNGKIQALDLTLYNNSGSSLDESKMVSSLLSPIIVEKQNVQKEWKKVTNIIALRNKGKHSGQF